MYKRQVLEIKTDHHSPDFAKSYGFRMALVELLKDDSLYVICGARCHMALVFAIVLL